MVRPATKICRQMFWLGPVFLLNMATKLEKKYFNKQETVDERFIQVQRKVAV